MSLGLGAGHDFPSVLPTYTTSTGMTYSLVIPFGFTMVKQCHIDVESNDNCIVLQVVTRHK